MSKTISSSSGSGFLGDWIEPAALLGLRGKLDYLALEYLAKHGGHDVEVLGFALLSMEFDA